MEVDKNVKEILNKILLADKDTSLYGHRKNLENLLEESFNSNNKVKKEYIKNEDFFIFIYELLKCFHIYDNFYKINKIHTLKNLENINNVFNFINIKNLENDDEINSMIEKYSTIKDKIINNLRELENKINQPNLFFNYNFDSDKIYNILKEHYNFNRDKKIGRIKRLVDDDDDDYNTKKIKNEYENY